MVHKHKSSGFTGAELDHDKASGQLKVVNRVKVPGNEVTCSIKRGGHDKSLKLTPVPMPADLIAKYVSEHMMEHADMDKGAVAKK
jgi:hypothetical protein